MRADLPSNEGLSESPYRWLQSRAIVRLYSEFICSVGALLIREVGDFDIGLVYTVLLSKADCSEQAIAGAAPDTGRPISINGLSRSVTRPFETVRRQCGRLTDMGLAERVEAGMIASSRLLTSRRAIAVRHGFHEAMVRLIEDLGKLGLELPRRARGEASEALVERTAYELMLFALEFGAPPHAYRGWTNSLIFAAIMTANARGFAFDPELSLRFAGPDTPPPDAIRRPVTAGAIARALDLPYATVRRHAETMVAKQELLRKPQGYLTSTEWMQRADVVISGQNMSQQLYRLLRQLGAAGFPLDAPELRYRRGRPELVDFG